VEKVNIFSDGEDISTVTNHKFLVVLITNGSNTNEKRKKRISLRKSAMANLTKIVKDLEDSTNTKVKATQDYSFSSSAVWVQRKADKRKTDNTMANKKVECIRD
jgi:hypothetical protein